LIVNLTPFKHPEKSTIFLGTRFIPLSWKERGKKIKREASPLFNSPFSRVVAGAWTLSPKEIVPLDKGIDIASV